jgi:hypothetical protein
MSGKWKWGVLALVLILAGAGFYFIRPVLGMAGVASEYVARRACLCVFVGGGDLPTCMLTMPDMLWQVEAELLEEERAVRARLSFLAQRTAHHRGGLDCTLD